MEVIEAHRWIEFYHMTGLWIEIFSCYLEPYLFWYQRLVAFFQVLFQQILPTLVFLNQLSTSVSPDDGFESSYQDLGLRHDWPDSEFVCCFEMQVVFQQYQSRLQNSKLKTIINIFEMSGNGSTTFVGSVLQQHMSSLLITSHLLKSLGNLRKIIHEKISVNDML